ncbi:alpha/beta hydrolase [Intrasporangium chromatireducens Q5-1]|uniref:Alpha/beta hydrolase n=1 Tax=Intrasporangium chromatireducens Q5-1 TaxID=584657 RepID=W9GM35_9MICO|nr:alpha/beta hydrolase [Intrasporangium chromatireducens]EWT07321.1 alpha/beta hydrolase [Intrasporangium chromatireducens Q5-1]
MSLTLEQDSVDPWTRAYAQVPTREVIEVDDHEIAVSVWPDREPTGTDLVLIHGGAAQRSWWDHLAPLITGVRRVVALDLSGHGESSRRQAYTLDGWSDEAAAVAAQLCHQPVLVGHSMGGLVAVNAAQRGLTDVAGVMALDSPLRRSEQGYSDRRAKIASRPVRSYDTWTEAVAGYKTFPPVVAVPDEVMTHIVQFAYGNVEGRWELKFDPRIYDRPQVSDDFLIRAEIPTIWVKAEYGFVDQRMAERIPVELGPKGSLIEVPDATHHLILEQPLASAWVISYFIQQLSPRA